MQVLDCNISHQQAITILQQARGSVDLVVARGSPELQQSSGSGDNVIPSDWCQVGRTLVSFKLSLCVCSGEHWYCSLPCNIIVPSTNPPRSTLCTAVLLSVAAGQCSSHVDIFPTICAKGDDITSYGLHIYTSMLSG